MILALNGFWFFISNTEFNNENSIDFGKDSNMIFKNSNTIKFYSATFFIILLKKQIAIIQYYFI